MKETYPTYYEAPGRPYEWDMETRPDGIETKDTLTADIGNRLNLWDDDEPDVPEDTLAVSFRKGMINTNTRYWDYETQTFVYEPWPVAEYLTSSDANPLDVDFARKTIINTYLDKHPDTELSWWLHIDDLDHVHDGVLDRGLFTERLPHEQFIVGQREQGVRFYNFGRGLSETQREDCGRLVDMLTQYYGDRTYDYLADVIVTDFNGSDEAATDGFMEHGALFINARLLDEDIYSQPHKLGRSGFLAVMLHESEHAFHGDSKEDDAEIEVFAEAVGWDIAAMKRDGVDWRHRNVNLEPYRPDGEAPSNYWLTNPRESLSETNSHAILGGLATAKLTNIRDAWLDYTERRLGPANCNQS